MIAALLPIAAGAVQAAAGAASACDGARRRRDRRIGFQRSAQARPRAMR